MNDRSRLRRLLASPLTILALLFLLIGLAEAGGGPSGSRQKEILERLVKEADILINLSPWEVPATSDMIALGKQATPALANGLVNNMDASVRATCASVLAATRDPRALEPLLDALDDPEYEVQSQAISALGTIESRAATSRLLALLEKPHVPSYVKNEAVRALGRLGDPTAVGPLFRFYRRTWDPAAQRALWDLRRHLSAKDIKELIIAPLQATPGAAPGDVVAFAVEKAGVLALSSAAEPLRQLAEEQPYLQNQVVYSLGRVGNRSSIPWLRGLLDRSANARLLNNVVFALHRLGDDPLPFLRQALTDRRAYIRFNAAFVAGDLRDPAMVGPLEAALSDPNDYVRSEVAVALGRIGVKQAIPALEKASHENNPIVVRDALLSLAAIDYPTYVGRVLSELVPHELESVRSKALEFLASRGDASVISPALAALDPEDYSDQVLALALLERFDSLDNQDATAFLIRVAAGEMARHRALTLLARFKDERSRYLLRQWLSQPAGEQDQLMRALGLLKDEASRPAADRWKNQEDIKSRLHSAFLLASLGDTAGADVLVGALEAAPLELKRVAATLLTQLNLSQHAGLQAKLQGLLSHEDVYVRLYAARALAEGGDAKAFSLLQAELAKKIPFIQDEVLDIVERAPKIHREKALRAWLEGADEMLRPDLERLLGSS